MRHIACVAGMAGAFLLAQTQLAFSGNWQLFAGRWHHQSSLAAACNGCVISIVQHGSALLLLTNMGWGTAIEADRTVAEVLRRASGADAYLYSAGVADESSVLVDSGYLGADDVAELVRKGAVGDVVGRYIDAQGNIVDASLDERTVGLGLDELRAAKTAIFVVAGTGKHDIARAVVTSGLCTVIVTDESTAQALLEEQ